MKAETQLRKHLVVPEMRHHMYLQPTPFNFALLALGCFDDVDAGRLFGLNSKTVERAREGGAVSAEFMGNVMAAFKLNAERLAQRGIEVRLDAFFEEATREDREPADLEAAA